MQEPGSVTVWISKLKEGELSEASYRLWGRYFNRLVKHARNRLGTRSRAAADEEDVAISVFDTFLRGANAGQFPRLDDRDDLWQVLSMLASRKAADQLQAQAALKRGGGKVVNFSSLEKEDQSTCGVDPAALDVEPLESVSLAEGLDQMFTLLGDQALIRVAVYSMEGLTNAESAAKLKVSVATVERKLKTIRDIYTRAGIWVDPEARK